MNFDNTDRPTTLAEFVEGADAHYRTVRESTPDYRIGQAYANYGATHFPVEFRRVVMTATDPFHRNDNLGRFLTHIVEHGWVRA